jgi:PAS domain S-box-containing protein
MQHGLIDAASLQRMLYETLDRSDDCVLVVEKKDGSADLVIASVNDAFCRASGFGQEELIRQPLNALIAKKAEPAGYAELEQAARDVRSVRCELLCNRKDGNPFWFGLHMMPTPGRSPPSFVVLGRDITEARQARQQQAAIQGLLAKVFLVIKAPVAIVSDDGMIQMTNPALDELLAYPPGGLVGKRALECNAPSARPNMRAALERQMADGRDYTEASRLLRADGSEVAVEITSIGVQRDDLRRFRIITAVPRLENAPPTSVRIAGKIKLIGLEEIKEALGARWTSVAARAMASAEHIIRRRCGPRDTYSPTSDGGFLICFTDSTEDEATLRAAAMAREIRTKLIGDSDTQSAASVSSVAAAVEVPDIPGQSVDELAAIIGQRLNARLAQIEAKARDTLKQVLLSKPCRIEQVRSRRTHDVVAQFVKLQPTAEPSVLGAFSALSMADRQHFDLDLLMLGFAADQLIAQLGAGSSRLTMVDLDFGVLLDRRRIERYLAACEALDPRLRERLILVLYGMPKGFPNSRMLECVLRLRPHCHAIAFETEGIEPPVVDPSLLNGAIAVLRGEHLAGLGPNGLDRVHRLIDELHQCHAHVLARQVATWGDVQPLSRIGVDLISVMIEERDTEAKS